MFMARKKIELGGVEDKKKGDLCQRISQIRQTFFNDNNRHFSEKITVNEQALSQICSGKRNAGIEIIQKILDNMPEINANWLLLGREEMTRNEQRVGDIKNSNVVGVNVNGGEIHSNTDDYATLLTIVEQYQKSTEKYQEQIDRFLAIIEKKI